MLYQCAKCGRGFSSDESLSFCPFCGTAYFSMSGSASPLITAQRIVIGSDSERTIQEKYWKESQQTIHGIIYKLKSALPRFSEERPENEHRDAMLDEYETEPLDVKTFISLRSVTSTAEFDAKFRKYLEKLQNTFLIKSKILEKLRAAQADPRHMNIKKLLESNNISLFEDAYSVQLKKEEAYISDVCSEIAEAIRCMDPGLLRPCLQYDPKEDEWFETDKEEEEDSWPQILEPYGELLKTIMAVKDVLIRVVEENSTFILSGMKYYSDEEDDGEDFKPDVHISILKELAQEDYDPIFGQSPDELIAAFTEAVVRFSVFVNGLPDCEDWKYSCPEIDLPYYRELLDDYKISCLRNLINDWATNLDQELDKAYQEQRLDMITIYRAIEQILQREK